MTDTPFGFGFPGQEPDDNRGEQQPGGGFDIPEDLAGKVPLFAEIQKLLSWQGGPVNWDLARQLAISNIASNFRTVTAEEHKQLDEAVRLADHWLDEATAFPSSITSIEPWTRVQWIERTLPVWSTLCDPIAARVVTAMNDALPKEAAQEAGQLMGVFGQLGGLMFGAQVGQGLANLATEVLSSTEIGLPLGPAGVAALVPENVAAFGAGLGQGADEVQLFLALREAAYHRLFSRVGWLRQRLLDTVDAYARGITVDTSALEQAMTEVEPSDPESLQRALQGGMFEPQTTPAQQQALARLETLLALTEGWIDNVTATAAANRLPGVEALRETLRRRRATGGPAEQTFATLVGLHLRPRRLREAATLWQTLAEQRGAHGRDAVWQHPDLLPSSEDLDDPVGFAGRSEEDGGFPPLEGL